MKIKSDFVTNSSSSSFIVALDDITANQLDKIFKHKPDDEHDAWELRIKGECLLGSTFLDNFDMYSFMKNIGVDMEKVEWHE